jgi:hypothetical protein
VRKMYAVKQTRWSLNTLRKPSPSPQPQWSKRAVCRSELVREAFYLTRCFANQLPASEGAVSGEIPAIHIQRYARRIA